MSSSLEVPLAIPPMIWPSPEKATLTIFAGTLDLPLRPPQTSDRLPPLRGPETAAPEQTTEIRPGAVRIDRIGLELSTEGKSKFNIKDDDPLSAVAEVCRIETKSRKDWQVRIETRMRLSCPRALARMRAAEAHFWSRHLGAAADGWKSCSPLTV
jgi:hypothetical protein